MDLNFGVTSVETQCIHTAVSLQAIGELFTVTG